VILTIRQITQEVIGQGRDQKSKPVIWFAETQLGYVVNITNASIIAQAFGDEMDNWTGKQIQLTQGMTTMQGRPTPCIMAAPVFTAPSQPAGWPSGAAAPSAALGGAALGAAPAAAPGGPNPNPFE